MYSLFCMILLFLFVRLNSAAERRCGYDGHFCVRFPYMCSDSYDYDQYCDGLVNVTATSDDSTRLDIWGSPLLSFGGTPRFSGKWVGINFSPNGDTVNSPSVFCTVNNVNGDVRARLSWNTIKDNLNPDFIADESVLDHTLVDNGWSDGFRCTINLSTKFTIAGRRVNLAKLPYVTVTTGLIENGKPQLNGVAWTFLAKRVTTAEQDRTFLYWCKGGVNKPAADGSCSTNDLNGG